MEVRQIHEPFLALGIVTHFIAQRAPFSRFCASDLLATLDGQIRRKHYLIALEGQRVVGYLGWALFDAATAARLAATMETPSNALADRFTKDGDVVWILTAAVTTQTAMRRLAVVAKGLYPGKSAFGVRHGDDGRVSIRRVQA